MTRADTDGGATITWTMTSTGLVGSAPCPLTSFRFSFRNVYYDRLPSIIPLTSVPSLVDAPATAPPPPVAQPDGRGGVNSAPPDTSPSPSPVEPTTTPTGTPTGAPVHTTPSPTTTTAPSAPSAPRVLTPLYLGGLGSGRVILNFQLDRRPRALTVTIDGRRAKIAETGGKSSRPLYQPTAPRGRMLSGHRYLVVIHARSASGRTLAVRRRLYLHRAFTPSRRLAVATTDDPAHNADTSVVVVP